MLFLSHFKGWELHPPSNYQLSSGWVSRCCPSPVFHSFRQTNRTSGFAIAGISHSYEQDWHIALMKEPHHLMLRLLPCCHNKRLSNNSTRPANAFTNARQLYLTCRMKPLASV